MKPMYNIIDPTTFCIQGVPLNDYISKLVQEKVEAAVSEMIDQVVSEMSDQVDAYLTYALKENGLKVNEQSTDCGISTEEKVDQAVAEIKSNIERVTINANLCRELGKPLGIPLNVLAAGEGGSGQAKFIESMGDQNITGSAPEGMVFTFKTAHGLMPPAEPHPLGPKVEEKKPKIDFTEFNREFLGR